MDKKNSFKIYVYAIISVLSFIAVCVGTSIAFFTLGSGKDTEVKLKSADVFAVFEAENSIKNDNIVPGFEDELIFSIVNVSKEENVYGNYTLKWEILSNEIDDDAFGYTLEGTSYRNDQNIPDSDNNHVVQVPVMRRVPASNSNTIIGTGIINTGVTHKYKLKLMFLETGENQDNLQNKKFDGKVMAVGDPNI